jgi:hypothetical protein
MTRWFVGIGRRTLPADDRIEWVKPVLFGILRKTYISASNQQRSNVGLSTTGPALSSQRRAEIIRHRRRSDRQHQEASAADSVRPPHRFGVLRPNRYGCSCCVSCRLPIAARLAFTIRKLRRAIPYETPTDASPRAPAYRTRTSPWV